MDLTTTKKITRRVLNILPTKNAKYTPCQIKVVNWFKNKMLTNTKFRISGFYMQNQSIPCFIPKYCPSIVTNQQAGMPLTFVTGGNNLDQNILDYYFVISNGITNYTSYVYMAPAESSDPQLQPLTRLSREDDLYNNRYFYFYDTEKFCQIVGDSIKSVLVNQFSFNFGTDTFEIIKTNENYQMIINKTFFDAEAPQIYLSKNLYDLFKFPVSKISEDLYKVIFNPQPETYGTIPVYSSYTRYIPDTWFPFDIMVIKTDISVEKEQFYSTDDYQSKDNDNIMLTFKLIVDNPDGIYNYFNSDINPDSGWLSMNNTNSGENATFRVQLRLKYTNDYFDYTILQNERAYFVTEEIQTE